jgi:hypothetical protein
LTSLELAKVLGGLDQPLDMSAKAAGAAALEAGPRHTSQVLADAIERGRTPAVIAAIEVLGHAGQQQVLASAGAHESALAMALTHPDRRVRLTAALTALKLNPKGSFAGASRVLDTLAHSIQTTGVSRVLVGHPRGEDAQSLIGFMNDLSYDGEAAYTGRRLFERAAGGVDHEFILISDAIDGPPIKELVQWLRRDFRTAHIPIGVMAKSDNLDELRSAFEDDRLMRVFPRIHSTEVARREVDHLHALAGRNLVGRDERLLQAAAAIDALGKLAETREGFSSWNILRTEEAVIAALDNSVLAAGAMKILGKFGTPKSQTALVEFASQSARPVADRQAAVSAFSAAVLARGLNLTQRQIVAQYDRYNASQRLDAETQAVLGSILDAIEAPTAAKETAVSTAK